MGAYDYESKIADLQNRYNQDNAAQEYGRFISQQRFSRQKQDMNDQYTKAFPKFTGAWAGRLGSGIKSGVMRQDLADSVNGFNRNMGQLDTDNAAAEGQFASDFAARQAAYQKMLLGINDDYARERASQNAFGGYQGVYQ